MCCSYKKGTQKQSTWNITSSVFSFSPDPFLFTGWQGCLAALGFVLARFVTRFFSISRRKIFI